MLLLCCVPKPFNIPGTWEQVPFRDVDRLGLPGVSLVESRKRRHRLSYSSTGASWYVYTRMIYYMLFYELIQTLY